MRGTAVDGDAFRRLRKEHGLTQEQLAERAGVDVKTVRNAERGKRLDLDPLTKFSFVLQTELRHLILSSRSARQLEIGRRDVALKWCHLWDAREIDAFLALYHEDAVMHLPGAPQIPFGGTFRGKQEIRHAYETAWSTCRTEPGSNEDFSLLVSDNTVVLQCRKGVYLPDDSLAKLWCTQIFTFEEDFIIDHHVEYDTLTFARLLLLPS